MVDKKDLIGVTVLLTSKSQASFFYS